MPTAIRTMAHIIMKTVMEQIATKTSFLRSGSVDFQTTLLGTAKTIVVSKWLVISRHSFRFHRYLKKDDDAAEARSVKETLYVKGDSPRASVIMSRAVETCSPESS